MSSDRLEPLAELFTKLKFRRQIIGGLSEADVWKKLEEVQTEYRRLYDLQAAGNEAKLKEVQYLKMVCRNILSNRSTLGACGIRLYWLPLVFPVRIHKPGKCCPTA